MGDGYVNFGYLGAVAYPALLAYILAVLYQAAFARPHESLYRFCYLVGFATLIQVLRDGLVSAFTFALISAMPAAVIAIIHLALPPPMRIGRVEHRTLPA